MFFGWRGVLLFLQQEESRARGGNSFKKNKEKKQTMMVNILMIIGVLVLCVIAYGIMEYLSRD